MPNAKLKNRARPTDDGMVAIFEAHETNDGFDHQSTGRAAAEDSDIHTDYFLTENGKVVFEMTENNRNRTYATDYRNIEFNSSAYVSVHHTDLFVREANQLVVRLNPVVLSENTVLPIIEGPAEFTHNQQTVSAFKTFIRTQDDELKVGWVLWNHVQPS